MVKLLEQYGVRVQKSAFEIIIKEKEYKYLVKQIEKVIAEVDDVRFYKLNNSNEIISLGNIKGIYEEDVMII